MEFYNTEITSANFTKVFFAKYPTSLGKFLQRYLDLIICALK